MYCKTSYRLRKKVAYINCINEYLDVLDGCLMFDDVDDLICFLELAKQESIDFEEYAEAHGIGLGIEMIKRCQRKRKVYQL